MSTRDEGLLEVPISALEHYSYCPRQCALIHVEQTYDENIFTIRGSLAHERADSGASSRMKGIRTVRALPLWSDRIGLIGKADAVELHPSGPVPVEYKVGRAALRHADVQLCAQALCLEEMFETTVETGALYSHASKRRTSIAIGSELRARTVAMVEAIREMLLKQSVPPAPNDARCPRCSLLNACLPSVVGELARVRGYQGSLFVPVETLDTDDD